MATSIIFHINLLTLQKKYYTFFSGIKNDYERF
jgi:hypothetical protein